MTGKAEGRRFDTVPAPAHLSLKKKSDLWTLVSVTVALHNQLINKTLKWLATSLAHLSAGNHSGGGNSVVAVRYKLPLPSPLPTVGTTSVNPTLN